MKAILIAIIILSAAAFFVVAGAARERRREPSAGAVVAQPRPAQPLGSAELRAIIAERDPGTVLVDVRTLEEFRSGAIPSAVNIPYDRIAAKPPTDDLSARVIVYCRSGSRSAAAARTLAGLGYTNVLDFGGIHRWDGELVRPQ